MKYLKRGAVVAAVYLVTGIFTVYGQDKETKVPVRNGAKEVVGGAPVGAPPPPPPGEEKEPKR
ncbi:hypothetical protein [Hydrogenimonas sp.]